MTVTLHDIQKDYIALAPSYNEKWETFNNAAYDYICHNIERFAQTPKTIADLGCGTGNLLKRLADTYPNASLTGYDGTAAMLAQAKEACPQARYIETDLDTMSFEQTVAAYDIVISCNVLHHLNHPQAHLEKIHKLCHEQSLVLLCDIALDSYALKFMDMYWRLMLPSYNRGYAQRKLYNTLYNQNLWDIQNNALLKPDAFWRIQAYTLRPEHNLF